MLGYPEQMQKPGSINTSKTISSLRTVMPRLNISIPQALPTTQSLKMKQVQKKDKKQTKNQPQTHLPFQKFTFFRYVGFFFFFWELVNVSHVFGYNTWRVQASFTCA